MKVYSLTCPRCGADIEMDSDGRKSFCAYCGAKLFVDDGVSRTEHTHNVNFNSSYTNTSREREAEAEIEKAKSQASETKALAIMFIVLFGMAFIYLLAGIISDNIDNIYGLFDKESIRIVAPASSSYYRGKPYSDVYEELSNAGFTNIKTSKDAGELSFFDIFSIHSGDVLEVKVWNKEIESGKEYSADATVTIVYYCLD